MERFGGHSDQSHDFQEFLFSGFTQLLYVIASCVIARFVLRSCVCKHVSHVCKGEKGKVNREFRGCEDAAFAGIHQLFDMRCFLMYDFRYPPWQMKVS